LFYEEKKNPRYDVTTYVPLDNRKKGESCKILNGKVIKKGRKRMITPKKIVRAIFFALGFRNLPSLFFIFLWNFAPITYPCL